MTSMTPYADDPTTYGIDDEHDPIPPFYCGCGATTFATEAEQRAAQPDGSFKCPLCSTFASDHDCRCDEASDGRCWDCDTRHGSHGGPGSIGHIVARHRFERVLAGDTLYGMI